MNEKLQEILQKRTQTKVIDESQSLHDDLGIDSLGLVELMLDIEEAFDVTLDESALDPAKLRTVQDLANLVSRYVQ